jgi:hypothetical protein
MPSKRSTKAKRASAAGPTEIPALRPGARSSEVPANELETTPIDRTDDAAGRPAQRQAIKEAMARQNVRAARSPGAIGSIGRTVLLIALFTLVGLIAVWVLLAL